MTQSLKDKVIAALVTPGFEEREFSELKSALVAEGARVMMIAPQDGEIRAWNRNQWGKTFRVDQHVSSALCIDFDALLLPSPAQPDIPAINDKVIKFAGDFIRMDKPIAAICRAPAMLAKTGLLKGRAVASHISVRADVQRAGARWVNQEVVIDRGLITSSGPTDMPLFNSKMFNSKMVQVFCNEMREHQLVWWGT